MSALISLGSLVANSCLGFIDEMLIFSGICVIATMTLWIVGRWTLISINLLGCCTVGIAFCMIGSSWFLFGGEGGMTPPLFFWMICLMFLFDQRRVQVWLMLGILAFSISLFITESLYPELINVYYPSEEARFVDVTITYILALAGYCILVLSMTWLHMDTTKRLHDEQALRAGLERQNIEDKAQEREERLELLRRMSRGLAHDLNNLLMVISNSAEMIDLSLSEHEEVDEELMEDLTAVMDTAAAASRLTRRLLDQSLTHDQSPEQISLTVFLKAQVPLLSRVSHQVDIHLELPEHEAKILIHRSELEQVIMNLALNAIQAMDHQGTLDLICHIRGDEVIIEFEDTGSGIEPENLERIFEPLFTTKQESGGTGIGLSTVRKIINRYHGEISVSSQVGVGTTFSITLPLSHSA
jgi:signal transduction histidine kinase